MRGQKPDLAVIEGGLSKVPKPPSGMNADARAEWKKAAADLIEMQVLADSDLTSLEMYCTAVASVRQARKEAAKSPMFLHVKSGTTKRHPAHAALENYLKIAKQYASELGLTPASRNRKSNRTSGSMKDESAPAGLDL